ncbi:MAG: phage tail protein [Pseudomonadaceae bacterium]|nr:phage tail protein [Pseudomonadaceae bacterium]
MAFQTIHTKTGLRALARAEASGVPINLTHMAVGDGNGNPAPPNWEQTQLARERYRATINRVYPDPNDATRFTAELVIPATAGGWVMREVGVFDSNGELFVVGNLPDTYKPLPEEGSFGDALFRLEFTVGNASTVTIQVDPNIAAASQAWVINNITAAALIPGGTVGQLLGKKANADGAYEWQNPDAINVTVDTVAEKQLLAAGQTQVDLSAATTYGLAVYIDGLRLDIGAGAGEWQPDAGVPTRLHLGQSYPANTRITLVNNEPAGSAPAPLERGQDLADVLNKAQARTNLEIFSKDETRQMAPPGLIAHFARSSAPAGWLKANGAAISRSAYAELYAAVGTTYGAGDGFTTFNLPDLRGEFIRGWDDGRGVDGGRALGSSQAGSLQSHSHTGSSSDAGSHAHSGSANSGGSHNHTASSASAGNHGHSAWTDTQGAHTHQVKEGNAGPAWVGGDVLTSGDDYTQSVAYYSNTLTAGAHAHNVGIGAAGDHSHAVSVGTAGEHSHSLEINAGGTHSHAITINASGSAETRPRNIALLACIKF